MNYRIQELWCRNEKNRIFGQAYIPDGEGPAPLVIFSHELGNNHEAGVRYAERLAEQGIAAYVFDFCGGSAPGKESKSDGMNREMSVMTEVSDLEAVLRETKTWEFADPDKIFLLGASQGGLVSIVVGSERQGELAGLMLMYPALSVRKDHRITQYRNEDEVGADVSLFGGWMHVGRKYITDIWDVDFYGLLSLYEGKILLLHGDCDKTVPIIYSEKAAEVIKDCEFHVIKGGVHEFYGQPFEEAAAHIIRYVKSAAASKRS